METLKKHDDCGRGANVGFSILMRFTDATSELHHQIRKLIIVTCHVLRENHTRPSAACFLRAACSYLEFISKAATKPRRSSHCKKPHTRSSCLEIHARFEFLTAVIPQLSAAFLVKNQKKICKTINDVIEIAYSMTYIDAVYAGIRSIAQIVTTISTHPAATWSHIFETFELLLHRINFYSPVIQNQGHLVVRGTLQSFAAANPVLLGAASNALRDLFMKLHILCHGRNKYSGVGIFNLVITCFALMPREHRIDVLVYLKEFFELEMCNEKTADVITKGLHRVFRDNESVLDDVPVELLLEPICSICGYISLHKDFYKVGKLACLLSLGVPKIYSLDKQICKAKLPIVFDAILVLLEQADGLMLLGEAGMLRCIIAYIDNSWIKLGVDNFLKNANMEHSHRSQPTMIETLCAGYHKFLTCPYGRELVLPVVFPIVSDMLEKLGEYSSYLMRDTIKTLADMQKMPEETPFSKEQSKRLLKKVLKICGLDAIMAIITQEHVELLVEINQQLDSISVCESPEGVTTITDCVTSEYLYTDLETDEYAHVTSVNKERRKAGETLLAGSQLRAELDKVAKNRVKIAIDERLEVAAKMIKRFKL